MREPSVRTSRLAIAAALLTIILVGGGGYLAGRSATPPIPPPPMPSSAPRPEAPPAEPTGPLGRADLISLVQPAADHAASGRPFPAELAEAAGKRFELNLPFGCSGPTEAGLEGVPMQWRHDESGQSLRISVTPENWANADWGLSDRESAGTAEGFWIVRPWSTSEECPPAGGQNAANGTEPVNLRGQTLAIAQFFSEGEARNTRRSSRPFESVTRIAASELDASQGFRLHLAGRIEPTPDGNPVRCIQPSGFEQRPVCVIGARFEEVRIILPSDGSTIATWPIGRA